MEWVCVSCVVLLLAALSANRFSCTKSSSNCLMRMCDGLSKVNKSIPTPHSICTSFGYLVAVCNESNVSLWLNCEWIGTMNDDKMWWIRVVWLGVPKKKNLLSFASRKVCLEKMALTVCAPSGTETQLIFSPYWSVPKVHPNGYRYAFDFIRAQRLTANNRNSLFIVRIIVEKCACFDVGFLYCIANNVVACTALFPTN